jgi:hypothetical protein
VNVSCPKIQLPFCSYNCRGFNFTKSNYLNKLLSGCGSLFLQEHWLVEAQLHELGQINTGFSYHGMSGIEHESS